MLGTRGRFANSSTMKVVRTGPRAAAITSVIMAISIATHAFRDIDAIGRKDDIDRQLLALGARQIEIMRGSRHRPEISRLECIEARLRLRCEWLPTAFPHSCASMQKDLAHGVRWTRCRTSPSSRIPSRNVHSSPLQKPPDHPRGVQLGSDQSARDIRRASRKAGLPPCAASPNQLRIACGAGMRSHRSLPLHHRASHPLCTTSINGRTD
jgi:hypothetical protein